VRMRQPNREKALSALERVHEKLERLSEAYYDKLERDEREGWGELGEKEGEPKAPKPFVPPVLDLERVKMREAQKEAPAVPERVEEVAAEPVRASAPQTPAAAIEEPAAPQSDAEDEPKGDRKGAAQLAAQEAATQAHAARQARTVAQARRQAAQVAPVENEILEKSEVLLGSKGRKAPLLGKLKGWLAKEKKKEPEKPKRDPNLIWGGTPKPTPEPEMKPSLIEHLLRVKQGEFIAEARKNVQRIAPGEVRPANADPGYNPPWARSSRPRYAIGAGEGIFDHYEDGEA